MPVCRTRGGIGLFVTLHAPGGDSQLTTHALDERGVTFRWKDYRAKGKTRHKTMTLTTDEFMRRFLLHVLPGGFRRIRHFGFLANVHRTARLAQIRAALDAPDPPPKIKPRDYRERAALLVGRCLDVCRLCGGRMIEIALLPRERPKPSRPGRCDTS